MCLYPFKIGNVNFLVRCLCLCVYDAPISEIRLTIFVALKFDNQNNAVRRDSIGYGRSGHCHAFDVHHILSQL